MRIYFQNKREKNKRPREYREGDEIGKQSEKTTECRRDPFSAAEAVENRENVSYNGSGYNEREQKSHFFSRIEKNGQKADDCANGVRKQIKRAILVGKWVQRFSNEKTR